MARRGSKRRLMGDINIVPYIDVMLVLLVIFMITTPLLNRAVHVNLPQASAQPLNARELEKNKPIVLTVDKNGNLFLNIASDPKQSLSDSEVTKEVSSALQQKPQPPVLVRGDHDVPYGRVVQAMVLLQKAGAPSVGLMTRPPKHSG
ncbi:MAG TPA: protein TolR [Gammaproteobacteria bacterium]|nr:protein TolR [Gammaproteobacteria bacterium]